MKLRLFALVAFFCAMVVHMDAFAQNYLYAIGNPPFSTQIPIENGFINVNNGDIHIEIPLATHGQRGDVPLDERLIYDSRIWKIVQNGGYSWQPTNVPNSMGGWTFQSGIGIGTVASVGEGTLNVRCDDDANGRPVAYYGYGWTDPTGTYHRFNVQWQAYPFICEQGTPASEQASGAAIDASGYTIQLSGSLYGMPTTINVFDRAGNQVYPTLQDPNGNYMSSDSNGNLVDTLGRTPVVTTTSGNQIYYDILGFNGARQRYTVTTETISFNTAFNESAVSETSGSFTAIQSIALPDGTSYSFTYDSGTGAGNYGELTSVTLPTGGVITYGYTNFLDSFQNQNRWVHTRLKDGGTTTFTPATISNCSSSAGCQEKTTLTTPSGNDTVYTFTLDQGSYANASSWNSGIAVYQGSSTNGGTKLQTNNTTYSYSTGYLATAPHNSTTYQIPSVITIDSTLADVGLTSQSQITLDGWGVNPTSIKQWDYYTGSAPTNPTRETDYTYYAVNGGSRTSQVTLKDGAGNQLSQTTYGYDETTPAAAPNGLVHSNAVSTNIRGNQTSQHQWINTSSTTLDSTMTYDSAGTLLTSTRPEGKTTLGYDSTDTFSTEITLPTPSSGVSLTTSASFDANTGLFLNQTDANGTQTSYVSYDLWDRPLEIDQKDSAGNLIGKSTYTYTANQQGVQTYLSASSNGDTEAHLDTYGRKDRTAVANGQSTNGWYQHDTCYDTSGRVQFQSYSYQGTGFSQTKICSGLGDTYTYDALGRVTLVAHADGSSSSYSYTGRATRSVDENGVTRITQADGLNRLTVICEVSTKALQGVSPVSCGTDITSYTGFLTTYNYSTDSSDNQVTAVTQGQQTRTSKMDSLGRLVYFQEPERGTTTYSYAYSTTPVVGLTVTRTRPAANQTSATVTTMTVKQYDSLGRAVSITYNDNLTPTKTFDYDTVNTSQGWNQTTTYVKGQLADFTSGSGANLTRGLFSYDATGRVTTMWQCAPSICGTANQAGRSLGFSYDWAGNLTDESDPTSGSITYGRSPAGEVISITNQSYALSGSSNVPATLASNVVNGPNGPTAYSLGNGLARVNQYDSLGRLTQLWICGGGSTSANCSGGTQLYSTSLAWKGSRANSACDTVINQCSNYGYDDLNRLATTTATSGTVQNFSYSYDRYGNRWTQIATAGSGPQPSYSFNSANNQSTSLMYDAAGNVTNDGSHQYAYDAEGNIHTVDGGSTATYVYDALNRRVAVQTSSASYEYLFDYANRRTSSWLLNQQGYPGGIGNEGRIYWDGQQIGYRAMDGTTYFDHQSLLGTERMRTNYQGQASWSYSSLPWGDGVTGGSYGGNGSGQDQSSFALLDFDSESSTNHAQFRQYSPGEGRWLSPDPYDGSLDASNPQSFNRYSYVLNQPVGLTDPGGLVTCGNCGGGGGGGGNPGPIIIALTLGIEELFNLFEGPSFHGSLHARPNTLDGDDDDPLQASGDPDWSNPLSEHLGLKSGMPLGGGGIGQALGLPSPGCEFGACGSSFGPGQVGGCGADNPDVCSGSFCAGVMGYTCQIPGALGRAIWHGAKRYYSIYRVVNPEVQLLECPTVNYVASTPIGKYGGWLAGIPAKFIAPEVGWTIWAYQGYVNLASDTFCKETK